MHFLISLFELKQMITDRKIANTYDVYYQSLINNEFKGNDKPELFKLSLGSMINVGKHNYITLYLCIEHFIMKKKMQLNAFPKIMKDLHALHVQQLDRIRL